MVLYSHSKISTFEKCKLKYKFRYIDKIEPEIKEIEIHDYKTSGTLPNEEQIKNDRQLALYSIAVKEIFEVEEVSLNWHYLNFNKKISIKKTEEEIEKLKT